MPQHVRGVVARAKGEPVRVETIVVPDPGPGEAVVKVQACGVCHTDLHYREGGIDDDFPFLWALVLGLSHHRPLDPRPTPPPAARHAGPHRARQRYERPGGSFHLGEWIAAGH
jgi:mono/diheme cytochrome c family protein